ncbi:DUF2290 domain-containing protein [Carnobacterium divergens]|uniref:DUF2290 domain-containing protein n=1 Tax=Carnobacterium divergens TaxID=2748 RepID=A0AAW8R5H3_CARDV|nr:DUF2290 domain-containing protein [Carnobacterium divergens]MDT1956944.1 DUF2290 domain-containing protein [Carnobacterium divergens]MDT1972914.1 DUF2290 domain-containing protein [Carnobacterium divergens]
MSSGIGKIISHYNQAKHLLTKFELSFDEDLSKSKTLSSNDFSTKFKKATLANDAYSQIYQIARDYSDYNLYIPSDGSFFQFGYEEKKNKKEIRYAYFESPFEQKSYKNFLQEYGFSYTEVGDELLEDYQQYLSETDLKDNITNIRYDYSESQYNELIHPTSHMHIGQSNNIRLQFSYTMMPTNFVAFVLRNVYWYKWKEFVKNERNMEFYLEHCKSNSGLQSEYFSDIDKKDIYIL